MSSAKSPKTIERAKLYEDLELLVLQRLTAALADPEAPASVLASAVQMLRAGGVQARNAGAGVEGADSQAWSAFSADLLKQIAAGDMTEDQAAALVAAAGAKQPMTGPMGRRAARERRQADAVTLGSAA